MPIRPDDAALVEAVRNGRGERFAELVDRHAAAVFRIVRAAVRQEADAEDLAQETFLSAYKSLPRLRDPRRFRAHLLVIAARKATDYLRRKGRRGIPAPLTEEPPARPPNRRVAQLARVEAAVAALPPESRLVFALRHHEGLACTQIAKMLEVPEGTVYSRLSRTHAEIRRALGVER